MKLPFLWRRTASRPSFRLGQRHIGKATYSEDGKNCSNTIDIHWAFLYFLRQNKGMCRDMQGCAEIPQILCEKNASGSENFSDPCWLVWTSQMLISPSRPQVTIAWSCDTKPTWPRSERNKRTENTRKHQEETRSFLKLWEEEMEGQDALGIEKYAPWLPSLCGTWRETYQESIQVGRQRNVGLFAHCSKCTEPISFESWKEILSKSFFEFGTLFWSSNPRHQVFLQASHQVWVLGPSPLHPEGKRSPRRKTTEIANIVMNYEC